MQLDRKRIGQSVSVFMLVFIWGSAGQVAQAGELERALEYRQGVMNVLGWNMKSMGNMMKGKQPYDAEAFAVHAGDLAKAATLDVLPGFPEDSDEGETDARAEIWLDFDDFKQKLEDLRHASQALSEAAVGGDKAAMGDALGKTGKACKACHDGYKN
ncbi:MAG: cytochrome c [Candidatus Thiodiazotropha sp. (ex Notomyrtea botanica)]|nr:cytochrome c [Candidatus Thiodiazotropha sp. (ex Notomyrtea botanica)]